MRNTELLWKELAELQRNAKEQAMEHLLSYREQKNRYYNPDSEELDIMESECY